MTERTVTITIPAEVFVMVPKAEKTYTVDLGAITNEQAAHLIFHALKQKLGDATAGTEKGANSAAAVEKRLATVLNVPAAGSERAARRDPVDAQYDALIRNLLKAEGIKPADIKGANTAKLEEMLAALLVRKERGSDFEAVKAKLAERAEAMVAMVNNLTIDL